MARRGMKQRDGGRAGRSARLLRSVESGEGVVTGVGTVSTSGPGGVLPIAMNPEVREESARLLNQLLADTLALRDLYKKHHWQVAGPYFYEMHLLFDKHYEEQVELADEIGERIRTLGAVGVAMGADVAEITQIPRPPLGREPTVRQLERLLEAHEIILLESHGIARESEKNGDDGTNDLVVSQVIRKNELEAWFVGQHLACDPVALET